jgi:hypothetical protein
VHTRTIPTFTILFSHLNHYSLRPLISLSTVLKSRNFERVRNPNNDKLITQRILLESRQAANEFNRSSSAVFVEPDPNNIILNNMSDSTTRNTSAEAMKTISGKSWLG